MELVGAFCAQARMGDGVGGGGGGGGRWEHIYTIMYTGNKWKLNEMDHLGCRTLASLVPRLLVGGEKKEPGIYCLCMRIIIPC